MPTAAVGYRGRFAPSPTGPLHLGSLVAAMASYLDALACEGDWLLRIEDVDETRTIAGAADDILRTLDGLGFTWQGPVLVQSARKAVYEEAMLALKDAGHAFDCGCTRSEIAAIARQGPEGPVYPGTCREGLPPGKRPRSVRVRAPFGDIHFVDRITGAVRQNLAIDVGDFIIRRADGFTAYQLAVVLDDAEQGVNQVVRGADLLWSTPRQLHLQALLQLDAPGYAHVPLVLGGDGRKLSKQDKAQPVDVMDPIPALTRAWTFLGQRPPPEAPGSVGEFWPWASENWEINRVPKPAERQDAATDPV